MLKLQWLKRPKAVPKKRNLEEKINDSKPHISSLSFTKTSKKDHSFRNKVSFKKPRSFYEPRFTQHYKKYTPATQAKSLLTLQILQQKYFWLVSEKNICTAPFALHCT